MAQYYHVDEFGDPGMEGAQGSSSHFGLVMIQLPDHASLSVLSAIRETLHLPVTFEFHYYKSKPNQKAAFFQLIRPLPFRVRAVVVKKNVLAEPYQRMRGNELAIEFLTQLTLHASELDIANDILIVDGATGGFLRALRIRFSDECRSRNRIRPFRKIISGDSKNDDGLQLADMIAGAIKNQVTGEESGYYSTFANKMLELWQAP